MFNYGEFNLEVPNSSIIVFPMDYFNKKNKLNPFMRKTFGQLASGLNHVNDMPLENGFIVHQYNEQQGVEVFGLFIDCMDNTKNEIYYGDLKEKLDLFVDVFQTEGYTPNFLLHLVEPFELEWTEKHLEEFEDRDDCTITFVKV